MLVELHQTGELLDWFLSTSYIPTAKDGIAETLPRTHETFNSLKPFGVDESHMSYGHQEVLGQWEFLADLEHSFQNIPEHTLDSWPINFKHRPLSEVNSSRRVNSSYSKILQVL